MQGALDENELLENFIDLMRELHRFPSVNEVKLKARNTPGFPWSTTFARLGSKHQIAQRVLVYCASHSGHDDVAGLCDRIVQIEPAATQEEDDPAGTFGSVYLIKSGRYYKIGRSNAAGRREYELAIQMPEKAILLHSIKTDDPVGIEAYWHTRFKESRKNGEWFALTSDEIKAFRPRKFM
jgi:hypothetical protein